jgi:hypothetical protein
VQVNNLIDFKITSELISDQEPFYAQITPYPSLGPPENILVQSSAEWKPNELIGIAIDGIPMYSGLYARGIDALDNDIIGRIDKCGGMWGPTADGVRYHYRVAPACLYGVSKDEAILRRKQYIDDLFELTNSFEGLSGPLLIGYSLSGYPIYSPLDSRGALHKFLDNCNGKFVNGSYSYYATFSFPYIMGCDGPGVYIAGEQQVSAENLPSVTGAKYNSCPGGNFQSLQYPGACEPCPAGKYSSGSQKVASTCSQICPMGYYCPVGSIKPLKCPGGRYGSAEGLSVSECSGTCNSGYFCPPGSTSSNMYVCGNSSYFCPEGSATRHLVDSSFYSSPESVPLSIRYQQEKCGPGTYCVMGERFFCPAG